MRILLLIAVLLVAGCQSAERAERARQRAEFDAQKISRDAERATADKKALADGREEGKRLLALSKLPKPVGFAVGDKVFVKGEWTGAICLGRVTDTAAPPSGRVACVKYDVSAWRLGGMTHSRRDHPVPDFNSGWFPLAELEPAWEEYLGVNPAGDTWIRYKIYLKNFEVQAPPAAPNC
jgi:hypothetical protein